MNAARLCALFVGSLAIADSSVALDFSKVSPPAQVSDGVVSVGSRTIKLPPGNWTFLSYAQGRYAAANSTYVKRHTGYFANVSDKRFDAGLVVELGEYAFPSRQWSDEPCKIEGKVYKSLLDSTPLFPECIVVAQRPSLHKGATTPLFKPVNEWIAREQIEQSVAVYDISFMHFMGTGQGLIRLFIPASKFQSEQAVVELANKLPDAFRPFLQGRTNEVGLPVLP